MGDDVQDAGAIDLVGKTFEQASALLFAEAGRVLQVKEQFHSCLTAVDILAAWPAAA